jgi:N6-adenosine-specific RNA methylase IME4
MILFQKGDAEFLSYRTILMDPPWFERGGGKIQRGADRHYPLLKTPEILVVILQSGVWRPAPDGCHLYCWVTNNFLKDGIWLVEALGFRYITLLTWAKDRIGLGQYFRGQTEQLIFGVKGRLPAQVKTESTFIEARRGRHSAKPEESYEKIERVSPGPRLEMFARTQRPGWDTWGNEHGLF